MYGHLFSTALHIGYFAPWFNIVHNREYEINIYIAVCYHAYFSWPMACLTSITWFNFGNHTWHTCHHFKIFHEWCRYNLINADASSAVVTAKICIQIHVRGDAIMLSDGVHKEDKHVIVRTFDHWFHHHFCVNYWKWCIMLVSASSWCATSACISTQLTSLSEAPNP